MEKQGRHRCMTSHRFIAVVVLVLLLLGFAGPGHAAYKTMGWYKQSSDALTACQSTGNQCSSSGNYGIDFCTGAAIAQWKGYTQGADTLQWAFCAPQQNCEAMSYSTAPAGTWYGTTVGNCRCVADGAYGNTCSNNCSAGQHWDYTAQSCQGCPAGQAFDHASGQCQLDNTQCTAGSQYHWQDTGPPASNTLCASGCEYVLAPQAGNPEFPGGVINEGDGVWTGTAVGTGNACTPDVAPPKTNNECVVDDSGHAICFGQSPDCSTFDGGEFCIHDVPQGSGCVYNEKGFLCVPGSSPPPNTEGQTPTKDGTIQGDQNGDGVRESGDVYNTWNTTNNGGGGGGGGSCGGAGQPACKIDETNTPAAAPTQFDDEGDSFGDQLQDMIDRNEDLGTGPTAIEFENPLDDIPAVGCTSLPIGVEGHMYEFPGADGCNKLAIFRGWLAWAFYVMTAFYIFNLATRKPA